LLLHAMVGRKDLKIADPETAEYAGFKGLWCFSLPSDYDE